MSTKKLGYACILAIGAFPAASALAGVTGLQSGDTGAAVMPDWVVMSQPAIEVSGDPTAALADGFSRHLVDYMKLYRPVLPKDANLGISGKITDRSATVLPNGTVSTVTRVEGRWKRIFPVSGNIAAHVTSSPVNDCPAPRKNGFRLEWDYLAPKKPGTDKPVTDDRFSGFMRKGSLHFCMTELAGNRTKVTATYQILPGKNYGRDSEKTEASKKVAIAQAQAMVEALTEFIAQRTASGAAAPASRTPAAPTGGGDR
jgi:hypothetical protein